MAALGHSPPELLSVRLKNPHQLGRGHDGSAAQIACIGSDGQQTQGHKRLYAGSHDPVRQVHAEGFELGMFFCARVQQPVNDLKIELAA